MNNAQVRRADRVRSCAFGLVTALGFLLQAIERYLRHLNHAETCLSGVVFGVYDCTALGTYDWTEPTTSTTKPSAREVTRPFFMMGRW